MHDESKVGESFSSFFNRHFIICVFHNKIQNWRQLIGQWKDNMTRAVSRATFRLSSFGYFEAYKSRGEERENGTAEGGRGRWYRR